MTAVSVLTDEVTTQFVVLGTALMIPVSVPEPFHVTLHSGVELNAAPHANVHVPAAIVQVPTSVRRRPWKLVALL
jgi:hypothetical protein